MANLCALCASMNLDELPEFQDEAFIKTISGHRHMQLLARASSIKSRKKKKPKKPEEKAEETSETPKLAEAKPAETKPEPLGFKHHPNRESLQRAAADDGCVLCQLIEAQAVDVVADLETKEAPLLAKLGFEDAHLTFDLWVTKRPDGEDGLWVLTNTSWRPGEDVVPVAAIAFCSDEDSPMANVVKGRLVKPTPDSALLTLIASWLTTCDQDHPNCVPQPPLDLPLAMPTRIISIPPSPSSSPPKLVDTSPTDKHPYVALSYCWGPGTKHYSTTQASVASRRQGIDLALLPQTFRDAVALCRRLGVEYLWIDSLCICQDTAREWERESANMASVYANAYLTVAATGAESSDAGLFFTRNPPRSVELPHPKGTVLACPLQLDKEVLKPDHVEMRDEPLTQRAWGFQERVLSRRILHFARDMVYYECLHGVVAENGLTLPNRVQHAHYPSPSETAPPLKDTLREWYSLLWGYGPRALTDPSDKLPAMSGLARIYRARLDDEYLAGVWRKSILEGIMWQALGCSASPEYRAPSWSWASVDGIAATGFMREPTELAVVVDAHVDVDGENPFGRVNSGWIKLQAPLVKLGLSEAKGPTGHMYLKTEGGDEGSYAGFDLLDRDYEASAGEVRGMELYALVVARTADEKGEFTYHSLIVEPVGEDGGMRRVGFLLQQEENFGPGDLETMSEITLV